MSRKPISRTEREYPEWDKSGLSEKWKWETRRRKGGKRKNWKRKYGNEGKLRKGY
jgi:hypothetical protein